jgi:hypothetical protein
MKFVQQLSKKFPSEINAITGALVQQLNSEYELNKA